jgi:hypothetical protein
MAITVVEGLGGRTCGASGTFVYPSFCAPNIFKELDGFHLTGVNIASIETTQLLYLISYY